MYGQASPFSPRSQRAGSAYARVGLETEVHVASPHRLIEMLFDGLLNAISQAEGAMQRGEREAKTNALMRAVRILDEGLKGGLNLEDGGELAGQLQGLYGYASLRLTQANLNNDLQALAEVRRLLEPVREAWSRIAPTAAQAA